MERKNEEGLGERERERGRQREKERKREGRERRKNSLPHSQSSFFSVPQGTASGGYCPSPPVPHSSPS